MWCFHAKGSSGRKFLYTDKALISCYKSLVLWYVSEEVFYFVCRSVQKELKNCLYPFCFSSCFLAFLIIWWIFGLIHLFYVIVISYHQFAFFFYPYQKQQTDYQVLNFLFRTRQISLHFMSITYIVEYIPKISGNKLTRSQLAWKFVSIAYLSIMF